MLKKKEKLISMCLKKKVKTKHYDTHGHCEQCIELPRAIADSNGMPHKGDKSNARRFLGKKVQLGECRNVHVWPRRCNL